MPKSTTKTYTVTCPCDQKHTYDIGVEVKDQPQTGGGKSFTVEKYCPFCDRYVEFTIPDEPFNSDTITRE
ncbi:MAG: hypothetical protein R3D00_30180 [Bacteroidia bacterium]